MPTGAEVVISASTDAGVNLDSLSDSTAVVQSGVIVTAPAFTTAVTATTSAWAVTNRGSLTGTNASGVVLSFAGSSVDNFGTIGTVLSGNAISMAAGGTVLNQSGATITSAGGGIVIGTPSGPNAGGAGTVTNNGTIVQTGTFGDLVVLRFGGTVTNAAGATITATNGSNAVSVGQGTSRTVFNAGTITNSGAGFATAVLMQGGPSTLTNTETGVLRGTYNGVYASTTGVMTLTNAGLIESTGPNASARALELTGGGSVVNTGTISSASSDGIYFGRAGSVENFGTISGAVRAINFVGNYARSLTLGTGSVLNGLVQGGTGTDSLVLQGSGTEDASRFLSFETFEMQGADWTLTGTGGFTSSGAVTAGRLTVAGTLTTPALLVTGGTLDVAGSVVGGVTAELAGLVAGTGSVGSLAVLSGGAVWPGGDTDMATLSVTGDASFAGGSTFRVNVEPGSGHDLLSVAGTATLTGGTVAVQAANGSYAASTEYTILTAGGGVVGTFAGVTSNLAFLAPSLGYTADEVILTLERNGLDFGSVGGTPNQRAAGTGVESAGPGNAAHDAVLPLDVPGARAAFDQLSGEIHASVLTVLLEDGKLPRDLALGRLREPGTAAGIEGWATLYGSRTGLSGDGNADGIDGTTRGLMGGIETTLDSGLRAGAELGFGRSSFDVTGRASTAEVETATFGLYAGQSWGAWSLRGGVARSWHDIETARSPAFAGFADSLAADYSGHTTQGYVEVGYAMTTGGWTLEPFLTLAAVSTTASAFAESGGDAAVDGTEERQHATITTLGLHYATDIGPTDHRKGRLTGLIGWRRNFGDRVAERDLAFGSASVFTVYGAPIDQNALLVELGLAMDLSPATELTVNFAGEYGSNTDDSRLGIGLSTRF